MACATETKNNGLRLSMHLRRPLLSMLATRKHGLSKDALSTNLATFPRLFDATRPLWRSTLIAYAPPPVSLLSLLSPRHICYPSVRLTPDFRLFYSLVLCSPQYDERFHMQFTPSLKSFKLDRGRLKQR